MAIKFKQAKLVQSKVTSTTDWRQKIGKFLTVPIVDKFIEKKLIEDNSLLFLAYGDKKEVVSTLIINQRDCVINKLNLSCHFLVLSDWSMLNI